MKKLQSALIITVLISSTLLFFISCDKEPTEVGVSLQPGSDKIIIATDTLAVFTKTVRDSSIATDERSQNLLGSYQDNQFGKTTASIITQVTLSTGNVSSETIISPDSLKLVFSYSGYMGDTLADIKFNLYHITDINNKFDLDSSYYSDFDVDSEINEKTLIGEYSFSPEPGNDSIAFLITDSDILNFFSQNSLYSGESTFIEAFNGFYLEAESVSENGGCIAYFNLKSNDSELIMYYNDNETYSFPINGNCVRFNLFNHDYTTAESDLTYALENPDINNEIAYLQSAAGLRVELRVTDVAKLNKLVNQGINRAQLQISIPADFTNDDFIPEQLTLVYRNDDNLYEFLNDYKVNSAHFGGVYNEDDQSFTFNIPLFLQDLLSGELSMENYLSMFSLDNRTTANFCKIYGGAHPDHPLQIKIITSKY